MATQQLSLWAAVFININIMLGAGVFINTLSLTKMAGFYGFLSYLLIMILIMPLMKVVALLLNRYPAGGFYTYGKHELSTTAGFFAAWAYFTGKLASVPILVHIFSSLSQSIIPGLAGINIFLLDMIVLAAFIGLNMLHMQTGKNILYAFVVLKIFPVIFAIISCFYLYSSWSIPSELLLWHNIPATLPLVLFAFAGFEACCSLSGSIENSKVNGPKAIARSFAIVVALTVIYQLLFFLTVGPELMHQENFLGIWPPLLGKLLPYAANMRRYIMALIYGTICASSLGGAYAILFSNYWNLYTLADNKHTFFPKQLTKLNRFSTPIWCVIIEGIICVLYFIITKAEVIPLQQISVLGLAIAYTVSVIGVLRSVISNKASDINLSTVLLALGSCSLFIGTVIQNFIKYGIFPLIVFGCMLLFGMAMYFWTKRNEPAKPAHL